MHTFSSKASPARRFHIAFRRWRPAEAVFGSVGGVDPDTNRARRLHHRREAFVSNVDGVLAMRLNCKEEESGKGCVRRVLGGLVAPGVRCLVSAAWQVMR